MIRIYTNEYVAIVGHLMKSELSHRKGNRLIVEKKYVCELMGQYAYETTEKKLNIWKRLRWIETDQDRNTKRIRVGGKQLPAIVFDLEVYETLREMPTGQ